MPGLIDSARNGTSTSPANKEETHRDKDNKGLYSLSDSNLGRHRYFSFHIELSKLQNACRIHRLLHVGHPNTPVQKSHPCSSFSLPDSTFKAPRAYTLRSSIKIPQLLIDNPHTNTCQSFLLHFPPRFFWISTSRNPSCRAVCIRLRHSANGRRNATSGTGRRIDEFLGVLRHTDIQSTSEGHPSKDQ
jgi:hypothetical protein